MSPFVHLSDQHLILRTPYFANSSSESESREAGPRNARPGYVNPV